MTPKETLLLKWVLSMVSVNLARSNHHIIKDSVEGQDYLIVSKGDDAFTVALACGGTEKGTNKARNRTLPLLAHMPRLLYTVTAVSDSDSDTLTLNVPAELEKRMVYNKKDEDLRVVVVD